MTIINHHNVTSVKVSFNAFDLGVFRKWLIFPIQHGHITKLAFVSIHLQILQGDEKCKYQTDHQISYLLL